MKILLIEDEVKAIETLKKGFLENHIKVEVAYDGKTGYEMASSNHYDVIISDIVVPHISGIDIVRNLRKNSIKTPVILLTALSGTDNTVEGLDSGADDYMIKPFEFKELLARLKALSRRGKDHPSEHKMLQFADIRMDIDAREFFRAGRKIELTPKEFTLIEYFIRHQGRVIPKSEIAEKVWDISFDTNTNMIEVYINYLRNKMDRPFEKKLIHTIFGSGYILKEE